MTSSDTWHHFFMCLHICNMTPAFRISFSRHPSTGTMKINKCIVFMCNMIPLPVGIPVEFHILWWQIRTCHVWMYACVHRCSVMNCKGITSSPRSLVTRIVVHDSFGSCHARECVYDAFAYVPPKNGLIALKTPRTSRLSTFYYCQVVNRQLLRLLSTYILVYYGVMANYTITLSNIQHHWQLSIASFFLWNIFTTYQTVRGQQECDVSIPGRKWLLHDSHDAFSYVTWLFHNHVHTCDMAHSYGVTASARSSYACIKTHTHVTHAHMKKTTDWCVLIRMTYSYAWHGVFVGFLSVCAITW